METFRFNLERVLNWQRIRRDIEEARLKTLTAALDRARADLKRLQVERASATLQWTSEEGMFGRDLATLEAYRISLARRETALANNVSDCEVSVAAQKQRCVESERRYRLFEKLKSRRRAEFQTQMDRQRENFAAEMHLARSVRDRSA